jgi:hypothetical protein
MVRDTLRGFKLNIVLGASKTCKECKELEDGEEGVTNMVVQGGIVSFGESARKEVIAMVIKGFPTERAWWPGGREMSRRGSRSLWRRRRRYTSGLKRWSAK